MTDAEKLDLGKVQLMGWTFIGLAIFVGEWIRTITVPDANAMKLPDLDGALWVLMGLANGAYLGGKLVRTGGFEGFEILLADPTTVAAASLPKDVTLVGSFQLSASAKINVVVDGKMVT